MRRDPLGRLARLAGLGRVLGGSLVDTNPVPRGWTHVTKVDPEEAKRLPLLFPLWLRQTSAVSVGGSSDVTAANTETTFDLLDPLATPLCHEPSGPRHVTDRTRKAADLLLVPEVLNGDTEALVGTLGEAVEYVREEMAPGLVREKAPWLPDRWADRLADLATTAMLDTAAFEAYIIQNPDSAAAREADVGEADLLSPDEARRRAMAADRHLRSEILYLEYSGTYGGDEAVDILQRLDGSLTRSRVWYGGGLRDAEAVREIRDAGADTVVVGDAFHDLAESQADLLAAAEADLDADALGEAVVDPDADPDADRDEVMSWVAEHLPAEDSAAGYLSTIPAVDDPAALAKETATAEVRAWLDLRARADRLGSDPSEKAVREVVGDGRDLRLTDALEPVLRGSARTLARNLALGVVGDLVGVDAGGANATHLAVPGPERPVEPTAER